jgi:hypothetical protein
VSLTIFVGPSSIGKSFTIERWLLPMLLSRPELATDMAPRRRLRRGARARSPHAGAPRRPISRPALSRRRRVDARDRSAARRLPRGAELRRDVFAAAKELGGLVLVVDELERAFDGSPSPVVVEMCIAARQYNSLVVGGCKRLGNLPHKSAINLERVFFGNLSDVGDRADCAKQTGMHPRRELEALCGRRWAAHRAGHVPRVAPRERVAGLDASG